MQMQQGNAIKIKWLVYSNVFVQTSQGMLAEKTSRPRLDLIMPKKNQLDAA